HEKKSLDVFIEFVVPYSPDLKSENMSLYKMSETDYMKKTVNYMYDNYKKFKNARFHFTDIRYDDNNYLIVRATDMYAFKFSYLTSIIYSANSFKHELDLFDIYLRFNSDYIKFITASLYIIDQVKLGESSIQAYSSKRLLKEISKLKEKQPKYYEILKKEISEFISPYLNVIFGKSQIWSTSDPESFDKLRKLDILGFDCAMFIADAYLLC